MGTFKSHILSVIALLTVFGGNGCTGSRILFLLPVTGPSHQHHFEPIIKAVADRGHEAVVVSAVKSPGLPSTVRQIQPISHESLFGTMPDPIQDRKKPATERLNLFILNFITDACEKIYQTEDMKSFIKHEKPFDLVFIDIYTNYCFLGLIPYFQAASIYVSTAPGPTWLTANVGNPLPTSFVPCNVLPMSDKMSFLERAGNTLMELILEQAYRHLVMKPGEVLYRKYIPGGDKLPGVDEIGRNISMIFMNSHFSVTFPRPLLPDVIEIGGTHTRPGKPLPKDMDDFLNGAGPDGFIVFSLGSVVKGKNMPEETRKVFLNVFSRLKQRVIWKWETESMPDLPKNVKLSKWLPQQDVLAHKNCKLFMSHGGLLSTQESIYHGVPVLGVPVFGDQDLNIALAEKRGYARSIEILDITEEKLEKTIREMLDNPEYKKKVQEFSVRVKDLPQSPVDKALYWTEYVLRHKGAHHLRSGARELNFFQYYLLDVTAALVAIVTVIFYLIVKCCKFTGRKLCGRKSSREIHHHIKRD